MDPFVYKQRRVKIALLQGERSFVSAKQNFRFAEKN